MIYYLTYGLLDVCLATSLWTISNTLKGLKYFIKNKNKIYYIKNNKYEYEDFIVVDKDFKFISQKELDISIKLDQILQYMKKNNKI